MSIRPTAAAAPWLLLAFAALAGCGGGAAAYDPFAAAAIEKARGRIDNVLAHIPPQCYTRTEGRDNPCWTCHTEKTNARNLTDDWALQAHYQLNAQGRTNHWTNLFDDRRAAAAAIGDAEILRYVRRDNYAPLRQALRKIRHPDLRWTPDLDLAAGFDTRGYARDGSGWRAFRYKPFPGMFWPTNGAVDEVFVRLPPAFRNEANGTPSAAVYAANLAIVEAAVATPDTRPDAALEYPVEVVDETAAGSDVDGDGRIAGEVQRIHRLPAHYAGQAADVPVLRYDYPVGTEFLHTVRYLDPYAPDFMAARLKELRYSTKLFALDDAGLRKRAHEDAREQDNGGWPYFGGDAFSGLFSEYGWRLTGYIEDAQGRLRLQTREEQVYCMGCHGGIGVTVDSSFSLPRKQPGAAGWRRQSLIGLQDQPQAGSDEPEILRYFERAGGGDEFRSNTEVAARFFAGGRLNREAVLLAAPGGSADIRALILPSRTRALDLDRAYLALVRRQDFKLGRDTSLEPARNVLRNVEPDDTGLEAAGKVFRDERLWLDWDFAQTAH